MNTKTAGEIKAGDVIIDREGIDFTVTSALRVERGMVEINAHNPMLIGGYVRTTVRATTRLRVQ